MFHKKTEKKEYDKERLIPVIRCSICTGEQVAGFKDLHSKKNIDLRYSFRNGINAGYSMLKKRWEETLSCLHFLFCSGLTQRNVLFDGVRDTVV